MQNWPQQIIFIILNNIILSLNYILNYSMEKKQSTQNWPKLDINEGEVKSYFQLNKNYIYTLDYTFNFGILVSIFYAIVNPSSLALISFVILVSVLPECSPYTNVMYFTQLALIILTLIIRQILINKAKIEADQKINKRVARVYRGNQEFESLQWGKIQQGDIVYLCQGEPAPADIIVLDSQQIEHRQAFTYVDVKNINGKITCQKKKSCYLTQIINKGSLQKRVWQQYRKIISGRVTYQKPSTNLDSFTGYLKLAKDPKVQKLSIQNLILRQSTIKTSLWVYGLVIYPGMDSKVMKSFKEGKKSREWVIKPENKIFLFLILLNIVLGIIFSCFYLFAKDRFQTNIVIFSYHILMFSIMLPHLKYLARDLFLIILRCSNKINEIQVRDYSNIQQLGDINFAIISNIGVLTQGNLQVNQIVTQSSIYDFQNDLPALQNKQVLKNSTRRRFGSSLRSEDIQPTNKQITVNNRFLLPIMNFDKRASALVFKEEDDRMIDENFQIDDDTNIRFKESPNSLSKTSKLTTHLQPLKLDKNRFYNYVKRNQNESTQIIKAISVCHQAKLYYLASKEKYQGVSNINSEEVLLKLVNYVGWNIIPKTMDKKQVGLVISEQKQKMDEQTGLYTFQNVKNNYLWCGINSFVIKRKLFSVVVSNNEKYTLYCKGKPQDILERLKLSKETQKIIEQTISSCAKKQSQVIIYAKRQLSEQERQIYQNDYISLKSSLTTNEQQIQDFSKKYEKNLQFICIIGLATKMNPEASPFIRHIRASGIKPCIFVNQESEITLIKKMIGHQGQQTEKDIKLSGQSAELIKYYLNQATNLINHNEDFKYVVTVSGKAWNIIRSNSQIMQHFMFVLFYSQALVAIQFHSEDIGEIARKIRSSYIEDQKVLGVGYSYSDLKFLGESNVSISTCRDLPTDIKVQNLQKICQTLKLGPYLLLVELSLCSLVDYRIIVMTTVTLLYQIIMIFFNTSRTINGYLVFLYLVVYTILEIFYNFFNFRNPKKLQQFNKYKEYKKSKQGFLISYLQAFFHGFIITLSIFFSLVGAKINQKKIFPIEAFDLSVFITLILVGVLRNAFNKSFTRLCYAITSLVSISCMILFVFIIAMTNTKFYNIYSQFSNIIKTYDSVTSIINCTLFCLAISLFLEEIIKKIILFGSSNNSSKQKVDNKKSMINLIVHLFKEQQNMEGSVQQIVSSQLDINKLRINSYLSLKKEEENIKFLSQRIPKNKSVFLKLNVIMGVVYLVLLVLDICLLQKQFKQIHVSLILGFIFCTISVILVVVNVQLYYCLYYVISIMMIMIETFLLAYSLKKDYYHVLLIICLLSVLITQSININFFVLLSIKLTLIVFGIVVAALKQQAIANKLIYPILEIICLSFNFRQYYEMEEASRLSFVKTQAFEKQSNYVNDILSILVPKFIKNHLQGNQFSLQQEQNKVSILFCYVCNFDQIVKQEGTNVVPLMDQLFRQFDQLCHNFAVQKIETVGQTYMAATGIKAYEDEIETEMKKKNQVQRLLKMAIQMLQKSKDIMWGTKKNKKLNLKIGIHHGNVIIGVIGYHKPQFSLIGDAVNTTSRHCSTAGLGQIVVSAVAYGLLRKFPASAFTRSMKNMKGLGQVSIFKYNNNMAKQHSHMKLRVKFQNVVKRVIQILKAQGKIQYKKFKASQLAEKVMLRQRLTTKKGTRISEQRKTIQLQVLQINEQKTTMRENKYLDLNVQYNKLMELQGKHTKFKKYLINKYCKPDRLSLGLLAAIFIIIFIYDLVIINYTIESLALCSIGIVLFPIMIGLYKKTIKHKTFNILYVLAHVYLVLAVNMNEMQSSTSTLNNSIKQFGQYYGIMAVTICSSQKSFRVIHTAVLAIVCIVFSIVIIVRNDAFKMSVIYELFYYVFILLRKLSFMKEQYDNFNQFQIDERKTQEQSALVSQLLPKHAYEKLKNQKIQNKLELTDRFQGATILFADIKGFTSYSNRNSPAAVVKMLRQLFEEFDKLCLKYNVYKLYTIGDCYVVLGFTNCYQRDYLEQAKNVVNMGLAMVETIQRVRQLLDFPDLDMRIGIHTGTIIGGIIGTQIVRYDIYGPDVMVANKFEQFGKTGFIHISESTKQILDQDKKKSFNIVVNGVVKVQKLNAQYNGYILTKKKFQI